MKSLQLSLVIVVCAVFSVSCGNKAKEQAGASPQAVAEPEAPSSPPVASCTKPEEVEGKTELAIAEAPPVDPLPETPAVAEPVNVAAPDLATVLSEWDINAMKREVQPDGSIAYDGEVRVALPDGPIVESDSFEITPGEGNAAATAIFTGNVRIRRSDTESIQASRVELSYDSNGTCVSFQCSEATTTTVKRRKR